MLKGLYLDDRRTPLSSRTDIDWSIVRSYGDFTQWIEENGVPDIISFDHDLAWEHVEDIINQAGKDHKEITVHYEKFTEKTGLDAARWLVAHCEKQGLYLPMCTVHSANPAGAANIVNYLSNYVMRTGRVAIIKRTIW